jgi:hypothetical protein
MGHPDLITPITDVYSLHLAFVWLVTSKTNTNIGKKTTVKGDYYYYKESYNQHNQANFHFQVRLRQ